MPSPHPRTEPFRAALDIETLGDLALRLGRPAGRPLDLGALGAWVVTAAAGARLAAGWLAAGGLRRGYRRAAGVPRLVVAGHLTLAVAGLGMWIGFVATGAAALAWAAVGVILSAAGLGMATLVGGLPEPAASAARPVAVGGAGSHGLPAEPGAGAPALSGQPVIMIVVHGALAASTILLVVLAAAGAG